MFIESPVTLGSPPPLGHLLGLSHSVFLIFVPCYFSTPFRLINAMRERQCESAFSLTLPCLRTRGDAVSCYVELFLLALLEPPLPTDTYEGSTQYTLSRRMYSAHLNPRRVAIIAYCSVPHTSGVDKQLHSRD